MTSGGRVHPPYEASFIQNQTYGNIFSEVFTGEALKSSSPDTVQVNVTTSPAWANKTVQRYIGETAAGTPIDGKLKGNGVQHDVIPFYVADQVISDIQNS
jgi:hypothetical protein